MKLNTYKYFRLPAMALMSIGLAIGATGCDDFELTRTEADYDPRYKGKIEAEADFAIDAAQQTVAVKFNSDMAWTAQVLNSEGEECEFASVSPTSGEAGENEVTVTVEANENISESRKIQLQIITEKGETQTINISQEYKVLLLEPAEIKDYEKYTAPGEWNPHFENGPEYMLRHDSYYSWHRSKQSDHFFVFWSPEFGEDPNAETVPANMRVDIDDLLAKAEQFFDTNVNKLGMATLGQGKSMLDNYKMQIYLIYQDEWLATGSGYDDKIGALWVNPSTCQPVGSTIAHEIGHSFQYQTYADRVQMQGVPADGRSGFRYGFIGPDGSGNGGCAYWEQCAQWQAQRDYPIEQFESYHFPGWLANCHRHFHHEFMRYESYWLQSYWVEKRGVDAYGRIWKESMAPEDAIMAYTRLYNNGDYSATRAELFDYAAKMATFDIDGMREYANDYYQDQYSTAMYLDYATGKYQISYKNCPGATGFNVIALNVPANGGTISVDFEGLGYGAALHPKDKGLMVDGDGNTAGATSTYNAVGGAENMGWRYGFVAKAGNKRTYSAVGKDAKGNLSFEVPAGTENLYLVVQGSPEVYMSHGWDEIEENDPQFPYCIKLNGTDLAYYEEEVEPEFNLVDANTLEATLQLKLKAPGVYERGSIDLGAPEICDFFGLSRPEIAALVEVGVEPAEGMIACRALNTDGTWNMTANANNGYWLNGVGDEGAWVGGYMYFEVHESDLYYGDHPEQIPDGYTGTHSMRPVFTYIKDGVARTLKFTIVLNY